MTTLILASTKRYFGFGDKDDRVVLCGGRVIGRIFLSPQAPAARNWMWTITVMDRRTIHSRGYSATREQAMMDFKTQWTGASENQEELSNKFARAKGEKWIGQTLLSGRTGLPLLPNAVIAFECEAYGRHDGGDHEIFVGRVVELHENQAKRGHPLVFFGGQYRRLGAVEANAPADIVSFLHGW